MSNKQRSIILVIICSMLGSSAQFCFKEASQSVSINEFLNFIINPYLIAGYVFYGISTIILTIALKNADLSFIYPFLSLTFVWVILFSPLIFHSEIFIWKTLFGVITIVLGITLIGKGTINEN